MPTRTGHRSGSCLAAGFTIIELAVTLTVIGIIAAVALPAMLDLTATADAGPLEPVRALLVQAHRESTTGAVPVEVVLVPTSGRYRVITHDPRGATVESGVLRLPNVRSRGADDRFRVLFDPVGLSGADTLVADGVRLHVDARSGEVVVRR